MSSYTERDRWRVRITGLSSDVTAGILCNQFEVASHRINISRKCAVIDGFDDEDEARKFISDWNQQFERSRIDMQCQLDENINSPSDDDQDKTRTPCRYGDRCNNPHCSYQHPPRRHHSDDDDDDKHRRMQHTSHKQRLKRVEQRIEERRAAHLPIYASYAEFCRRIRQKKLLIVVAETNTGKSSQLPQYAAESSSNGLVVCTQVHANTTRALARQVAQEYDGTIEGNSVGYQIRHRNDRVMGKEIMFMTDAALINEYQINSNLNEIRVLIIDEVQERSLNTDVVLGIAKLLLKQRSDDLHVVIILSTISSQPFIQFFDHPSMSRMKVETSVYPVAVENILPLKDCPNRKWIEFHLIPTLLDFYPRYTKHILVFLPTQRDIEKALDIFTRRVIDGCYTYSLDESSSVEEQEKVLTFDKRHSRRRMVVFCTSIAETTINIRNVQLVIDSGLIQRLRFDIEHRIHVLETVRISRVSADRRRDIVAYSKGGCCIRLYSDDEIKDEHIEPQIVYSSLDLLLLQLKSARMDPQTFPFITQPDPASVRVSLDLLQNLGCLDNRGKLTNLGQLFAQLSIDPRLSTLMVNIYTGYKDNRPLVSLVLTLVGILSASGSLFLSNDHRPHGSFNDDNDYNSDLLYLCAIFNEWRKTGIINRETNKCTTCRERCSSSDPYHSCRVEYALKNGLNHSIFLSIENSIQFYRETIIDPRWHLTSNERISSRSSTDGQIIGEHLQKIFSSQLGHLLVPHLPDEGVRLIANDIRASIASTSIYVQQAHDSTQQYFIAMSIIRSPSGRYIVDQLHQVLGHDLPSSSIEKLVVRDNIGSAANNDIRNTLGEIHKQTWTKWLVQEYDQRLRQLTIWGIKTDQTHVETALQPILTKTYSEVIECGPIRATFDNGLICTKIEITENALRLNLQRVPCRSFNDLKYWLKTKLNITDHDIQENNFQEKSSRSNQNDDDDEYEASPFYITLKSTDAFQRATANLSAHFICPQETLTATTRGTHMSEKDAWGRQLVLTIPPEGTYITAAELLDRLKAHAVDCRPLSRRSIRAQPGIQLTNLPRDADKSYIYQILQPVKPIEISLRQTHRDGTGSASAHIFFANDPQRQQAKTNLQTNFCPKPITITVKSRINRQLTEKQVTPVLEDLKSSDATAQTFLITAIHRQSAREMYRDIIPKMDTSWQIDSTATVTVTHPHLYPDFDQLLQQISDQFGTKVQQKTIDQKQTNGRNPIRCFFNQGTPEKTASAARMLAQATEPIIIRLIGERQKQLFEELFSTNQIQKWSKELRLESLKKERSITWVEIRGPQVQQGELMRRIGDYSDTFDQRFRIIELNSASANFFGRKKQADRQLQNLNDHFSNWGCHLKYVSTSKSIIIYTEPGFQSSSLDSCEAEVKQMLKKFAGDATLIRDRQQCVFCGKMSYSTNKFSLCGHAYCRCASSHLAKSIPLQCPEASCKSNISMEDILEIFSDREELIRVCKQSIGSYLEKNSTTYDQRFCPNPICYGLVKKSAGYQLCLTCGRDVCPACALIDDDSHQGRTCAERIMFQNMGDYLPTLFKAAEKFARDNWAPGTQPIIRVDYNMGLAEPCASMKRFYKGAEVLGLPTPPDMARGFFAFHGTAATAIKPICSEGFDPKKRAGQACGPGEYFGVTSAVSHGYCRPANPQGPFAMIIALLLNCPQLSTRPGFCYVMNNPTDWSHAYNIPVVVVSYGTQTTCDSPLRGIAPKPRPTLLNRYLRFG